MKYVLKNVTGLTFSDENSFLDNTDILIENGKIKKIGGIKNGSLKAYDMSGKIVTPGIINAHMHFYSTLGRGLSIPGNPAMNFKEVLEKFWWRLDLELSEEELYYSVIFPILEGIKWGTTTIFDHHVSTKFIGGSLDAIKKIMDDFYLKGTLSYEVTNRNGNDIFQREVRENLAFFKKTKKDENIRGMLGLHANMTLSDDDLRYISENTPNDLPIHCHLAESSIDQDFVRSLNYKNVTERLNKFDLLRKNSLLIHGVATERSEWELIRDKNSYLIHNPSSNLNNAVGIFDLLEAIETGLTVGIGTDGMHNIPLKEYQLAYYLTHIKNKLPSVGWVEVFNTLRNNGKIASNIFERRIGVIEEGADADLAFFDYELPTPINNGNTIGHFLFGMINSRVSDTISNGHFLMKDFNFTFDINQENIIKRSQEIAKKLWKRILK